MNGQQPTQYPVQHPQQQFIPNAYFDPCGVLHSYTGYYNPSQPQIPPSQPPTKADFIYRPVSNIEEAKASQIDWDGTVYFFEDKSTGQIYRKQFVNDGVVFTAFGMIEIPEPPKPPDYVTTDVMAALLAKIEDIEKRIPVLEENASNNNTNSNNKHGGFRK